MRGRLNLLAPGLGFSEALTGRENIIARRAGERPVARAPRRAHRRDRRVRPARRVPRPADALVLGRACACGSRRRSRCFLDPEILLIDEALTGGDAAFSEHIAEKTAQLTGEGRTIVIVTHGLSSVKTMATEALWLHQGRVAEFGDPDEVVEQVHALLPDRVARHDATLMLVTRMTAR